MNGYIVSFASALALTAASLASAAPIVSVVPSATSLAVGETARVDIRVDGLGDGFIGAYDLAVIWNGALLSGSAFAFDRFLDGPADSLQLVTAESGSYAAAEVSLSSLANQAGLAGFRLFSFEVTGLAAGVATFGFDRERTLELTAGDGSAVSGVEFAGARLTVTDRVIAVPEPASGHLLGALGVVGLLSQSWRRRAHQPPE